VNDIALILQGTKVALYSIGGLDVHGTLDVPVCGRIAVLILKSDHEHEYIELPIREIGVRVKAKLQGFEYLVVPHSVLESARLRF
jgi:hypothetical protein